MAASDSLARGIDELNLDISDDAFDRMLAFVNLMIKWNRVYNLTSVRDPEQIIRRHILDSLVVIPYLRGTQILDVGSGGGLPGIPLSLACPDRQFTLLDSNGKKTRFLTQARAELELANVDIAKARIEQYRPKQGFDTIISRAFSSVGEMAANTVHLCADGGRILAMKGIYPVAEMESLPESVEFIESVPLQVPGLEAERHLIILQPRAIAQA
jgi:16S rRNA (guanine527-N7)-methyltransferase